MFQRDREFIWVYMFLFLPNWKQTACFWHVQLPTGGLSQVEFRGYIAAVWFLDIVASVDSAVTEGLTAEVLTQVLQDLEARMEGPIPLDVPEKSDSWAPGTMEQYMNCYWIVCRSRKQPMLRGKEKISRNEGILID